MNPAPINVIHSFAGRASSLAALIFLCACITVPRGNAVVVEQLFFGRNVAGQLAVTDEAWQHFLAAEVTPRFPEGLTVLSANGQWRGANGAIEHEQSYVVELVHPANADADTKIKAIIGAYKKEFHQEAVMRLSTNASAAF